MEVKIGIVDSPRELVVQSVQTVQEVEAAVTAALDGSGGLLSLKDEKGRTFLVQSGKVAYVEIGPADARKVGFSPS